MITLGALLGLNTPAPIIFYMMMDLIFIFIIYCLIDGGKENDDKQRN